VEEPKKKRRLLIIDVDENNVPLGEGVRPVQYAALPPEKPVTITPGYLHGQAQQEVLKMCREARFNEEKIEDRIWIKLDEVLKATTVEEAQIAVKRALDSASMYFLMRRKQPEKQAKAAERIAKMYRNKGDDANADKQLAKAKKIRAEMKAESQQKL